LSKDQADSKILRKLSNFAKNLTKKKDSVNLLLRNLNITGFNCRTRKKLTIKFSDLNQKILRVS